MPEEENEKPYDLEQRTELFAKRVRSRRKAGCGHGSCTQAVTRGCSANANHSFRKRRSWWTYLAQSCATAP